MVIAYLDWQDNLANNPPPVSASPSASPSLSPTAGSKEDDFLAEATGNVVVRGHAAVQVARLRVDRTEALSNDT